MTTPTPLRSIKTDRQIADTAAADSMRVLREHIGKEVTAMEARVIETAVRKAAEEALRHKTMIAQAAGWRASFVSLIIGAALAVVAMSTVGAVQNRLAAEAVGFGTVIGKAETNHERLRDPDPDRDRGVNRGREPGNR